MRIALLFNKDWPYTTGIYFERACTMLGLDYVQCPARDASGLTGDFDVYLYIDHGDYAFSVPAHLSPNAFYAIDTHLRKPWREIRRLAGQFDWMFCAQHRGARELGNAHWVPLACDPEVHGRCDLPPAYDIAFVGNDGGTPRKFYLQALRERYSANFIGRAPHTDMRKIYSQSKIGFNFCIRDDVNMRIFEILCAGPLLFTNHTVADDLARLGMFHEEHLIVYRNPNELFSLMQRYLHDEAGRRSIADRGRQEVLKGHTYAHRLRQIIDLIA